MKPVDMIVIGILLLITAAAIYAICHSKKKGRKCIGCPDSSSCSGCCANCNSKHT